MTELGDFPDRSVRHGLFYGDPFSGRGDHGGSLLACQITDDHTGRQFSHYSNSIIIGEGRKFGKQKLPDVFLGKFRGNPSPGGDIGRNDLVSVPCSIVDLILVGYVVADPQELVHSFLPFGYG